MKKGHTILFAISLIVVQSVIVPLALSSEVEKKTAVSMVEDAVKLIKTEGKEKACKIFNDPNSKFVKGELYVFVYDINGVMIAHPKNPKLIGKNLLNIPDVDGKFFRKEIIDIAKKNNSGWVDYQYKNPVDNKIEQKTTYVVGIDNSTFGNELNCHQFAL